MADNGTYSGGGYPSGNPDQSNVYHGHGEPTDRSYPQHPHGEHPGNVYDYSHSASYNGYYQDYPSYDQRDPALNYSSASHNYHHHYNEQIDPSGYHYSGYNGHVEASSYQYLPDPSNAYHYGEEPVKNEASHHYTVEHHRHEHSAPQALKQPEPAAIPAQNYHYAPPEASHVDETIQYHVDPVEPPKQDKNDQYAVTTDSQYHAEPVPLPAPVPVQIPAPVPAPVPESPTKDSEVAAHPTTLAPTEPAEAPPPVAPETHPVEPDQGTEEVAKTSIDPSQTNETIVTDNESPIYDDLSEYADAREFPLDDVLNELLNYKTKYKDCSIPTTHPSFLAILDSFVSNGFQSEIDSRWDRSFEVLKKYKETNGDCDVPVDHPVIGSWVSLQRKLHKEGKSDMKSKNRFKKLDELGFDWNPTKWDLRLEQLKEYIKVNGHSDVPISHPELGIWVVNQRFNRHDMPKERADALDAIGFVWNHTRINKSNEKWDKQYESLLTYMKKNGQFPPTTAGHSKLSKWVGKQREEYKKLMDKESSQLTKYRIDKLNEIGFQWTLQPWKVIPWEERFEALKKFKEEHGHCKVPAKDPYFGNWPMWQRSQYKLYLKGKPSKLTKEKAEKLMAIGFFKPQDALLV